MTPWMFILNPFERWAPLLADYGRVFDLWQEGGVRGIVVGRLVFTAADGTTIPTFRADPEVYAGFGVSPPPPAPRDADKERRFSGMLDDAASRGWQILVFDVRHDGGCRPAAEDPFGAVHIAATASSSPWRRGSARAWSTSAAIWPAASAASPTCGSASRA